MDKKIKLIIILSLLACGIHGSMLLSPFSNYLYTSIAKIFLFTLAPIMYFKISGAGSIKDIFAFFKIKDLSGKLLPGMKLAFLLGLGTFIVVAVAIQLAIPFMDKDIVTYALEANSINPGNIVFVFFYIVIINAALEQFFFRGFTFMWLLKESQHKRNRRFAHAYSSLLFSFYHIPILFGAVNIGLLILATIGLIAAGLIFNEVAIRLKSIAGSLVVHISANLAISLMVGIHFIF